ncbi:MAG: pectinesterase family protein [Chloroflexota bacterium]
MHWDNLSNIPPDLADGDDDTTYTAGTGLALTDTTFALENGYQLPQACANGQIPAWNGSAWTCANDGDTTYSAGNGLLLNGTEFAAQGSPFANVVIVAQSGGDFSSVQAAIDSITDASAANPYLVWIAPGIYNEAVTLKPFVHVQGAGETAVTLSSNATTATVPPNAATLVLTASVSVRDLTVVNNGTGTHNVSALALAGSSDATLANVTLRSEGAGTNGYGLYIVGADAAVRGTAVTLNTTNHTTAYGLLLDGSADLQLENSAITAHTLSNNAFGIYMNAANTTLTVTQSTIRAMGNGNIYGLYSFLGATYLRDVHITAQAVGTSGTNSYGIYTFSDLVAYDVTAVGADARIYNYGLESYGNVTLYGGVYEGRNGVGTTNVQAAVGIHNRGPLYAEGVTARGTGHTSRNQGLDIEGGETTLVGGYFYGEGGTAAYGIENFGTGGVLTATAVTAIGKNGSSGSYGLYNGGPATLYGGSFIGSGLGSIFGTYGINNAFTIGILEAHGVTAVGEYGTDEVWGLRNWLGTITLENSSFTAISGTTAYGIDNDTSDASLTATGITVLAANASQTNIGLFNRNTADTVLVGGSFTARGGSVVAHGIYNQGSGSNLTADNVTIIAADSADNNGLRNQNSAISNITAARLVGTGSHALYMTSGIVRIGVSEISGGATRAAGVLTCFQAYTELFAAYTCP